MMRSVLAVCLVAVVAFGIAACSDGEAESRLPDLEPLQFPDPASSPYCLPYPVGKTATVSQAWGDSGTHRGRFSIDFSMPFGSQITAARSGVVTEIRDQYRDDDRTGGHENGVYVLHDDKTMAAYLHMSEGGVLVEVGDEVDTGDVIGLVGTTGTPIPHLHFEVYEGQDDGTQWYKTLPVSFANAQAPLDEWGGLRRTRYESLPCSPATS